MAVLLTHIHKKLKASTLVETLIASVLIVIVFTIASMTLNNVFRSTIDRNTQVIDAHLNKILYLYQYGKIEERFQETFKGWDISISKQTENNTKFIIVEALQSKQHIDKSGANNSISRKIIYEGSE